MSSNKPSIIRRYNGIDFNIYTDGIKIPQKFTTINEADYPLLDAKNLDWNFAQLTYLPKIDKEKLVNFVGTNKDRYAIDTTYINKTASLDEIPNWLCSYTVNNSADVLDIIDYLLSRCIYLDDKVDQLKKQLDDQTIILTFSEEELKTKYGLEFDEYGRITKPIVFTIKPNETNENFKDIYVGDRRLFDFSLVVKNMIVHKTLTDEIGNWGELIQSKHIAFIDGCIEMRYITETTLNGIFWKLVIGVTGWEPNSFDPLPDYKENPTIYYKTSDGQPISNKNFGITSKYVLSHLYDEINNQWVLLIDENLKEFPNDFLMSKAKGSGTLTTLTELKFENFYNIDTINNNFLTYSNEEYAMTNLKVVDLSGLYNVVDIKDNFLLNSSVTELKLNFNKLENIGNSFLKNCKNITNLDISSFSNVRNIGIDFLSDCYNLTRLSSDTDGFADISMLNKLTYISQNFLSDCANIENINISFSLVQTIDSLFLWGCSKLRVLDLSSMVSLETIKLNFLDGCSSLMRIYMPYAENLKTVYPNYLNSETLAAVYVPTELVDKYKELFVEWDSKISGNNNLNIANISALALNNDGEEIPPYDNVTVPDNDVKGFKIMLNSEANSVDYRSLEAYVAKADNIIDFMFINDVRYFYIPKGHINPEEYYLISEEVLKDLFGENYSTDFIKYSEEDLNLIKKYLIGNTQSSKALTLPDSLELNIRIFPRYFGASEISDDGEYVYNGSNDLNTPEDILSEGKLFVEQIYDKAWDYSFEYLTEGKHEDVSNEEYVLNIDNRKEDDTFEFNDKLHKGFSQKIKFTLDKIEDSPDLGSDFGMGILHICTSPTYYVARNDLSFKIDIKKAGARPQLVSTTI